MRLAAGIFVALTFLLAAFVPAGQAQTARELAMREWSIKADKMKRHLQPVMRAHGVDLWIILSREFNPDPALELFGGYGLTGWYGHRNAYLFYDPGEGQPLETTAIGTHLSGHLRDFYGEIQPYGEEGLAPHLKAYIDARDPQRIAVNTSRTISMADGLSAELKAYLVDAVGPVYAERLVSSEPVLIEYVSRRTPEERALAREASAITWEILERALSEDVVTPGTTTLMDVHWWIVQQWKDRGLEFNFPPSFSIQREGAASQDDADDPVIRPGDVVHVDFGIKYAGIVTDQQKLAYVLKPGETAPPAGLQAAFAQSVRMAELIRQELKPGVPGRDVKARAEARGNEAGIRNLVYSHVQGNWVHGAGAWAIHDWPERYGNHPRQPVRATEFWSIEFSTTAPVPEWGDQLVNMAREEDAYVAEDGTVHYLTGPQEALWLIPSPAGGTR